jgi:membrane protein DedA with SNARE-associated domain
MGTEWVVRRFPRLKKVMDKVHRLLHRMGGVFLFSFRFIYGIRIACSMILGASKISPSKFVFFNIISRATWAMMCCFVGYIIADVVMDGRFDTMPAALAVTLLAIIMLCVVGLFLKTKDKKVKDGEAKLD